MSSTLEQTIRDYIINTFLFGQGGESVGNDDSLLAQGIIDSTGVLELVAFLEETYGVRTGDNELNADNFDSISKLAAFVTRKLA